MHMRRVRSASWTSCSSLWQLGFTHSRTVTVTTTDCLWFDLTAADHDDKLATSGRNLLATTYYYSYHNYHEPAAAAAAAAAAGGDSAAAAAAASSGVPCFLPLLDCCCVKKMQTVTCSTIST